LFVRWQLLDDRWQREFGEGEALTVKRLSIYFEGTDLGFVRFYIIPVQHSSELNAEVSDTTKAS
jgi:hypothetical protein